MGVQGSSVRNLVKDESITSANHSHTQFPSEEQDVVVQTDQLSGHSFG